MPNLIVKLYRSLNIVCKTGLRVSAVGLVQRFMYYTLEVYLETNVPRLGANTPGTIDNTTYNEALALDLMKEYLKGNLPRGYIGGL